MHDTFQHRLLQIKCEETLLRQLQAEDDKIKLSAQINQLKQALATEKRNGKWRQKEIDTLRSIIAKKGR